MGQIKELILQAADKRAKYANCSYDEALIWAEALTIQELLDYTRDYTLSLADTIDRYEALESLGGMRLVEKSALKYLKILAGMHLHSNLYT